MFDWQSIAGAQFGNASIDVEIGQALLGPPKQTYRSFQPNWLQT